MLRRRPDDTYELLVVEQALWAARPAGLTAERRDALRSRIMSALGRQQEREDRLLSLPTERWVAVPVGLGLAAAAILVAKNIDLRGTSDQHQAAPDLSPDSAALPTQGDVVVLGSGWGLLGSGAAYGAEGPSTFRYERDDTSVRVSALRGTVTLFAEATPVIVEGGAWRAMLGADAVARIEVTAGEAWITAIEGLVSVAAADGSTVTLPLDERFPAHGKGAVQPDDATVLPPPQSQDAVPSKADAPPEVAEAAIIHKPAAPSSPAPHGLAGSAPPAAPAAEKPAAEKPASVPSAASGGGVPGDFAIPAAGSSDPEGGIQPAQDPAAPESAGAGESPPAAPGEPAAYDDPGPEQDPGQGNGEANGQGSGNANGQGNGEADSEANAQGNGNANGQGNGEANGQGNGNANGQGNGSANGQGNGEANGPGNGSPNGQGNGEANGPGNGNANGQGNGHANGQGNAVGNGQGNGNANGQGKKARDAG